MFTLVGASPANDGEVNAYFDIFSNQYLGHSTFHRACRKVVAAANDHHASRDVQMNYFSSGVSQRVSDA